MKKLILAGAAETEHVAILWYTVTDGAVGLHYHSKTESVYVIDGTQTDAKGVYPTGTVYFNPPGSGHQITDSSGFFVLAYASPPDFMARTGSGSTRPFASTPTPPISPPSIRSRRRCPASGCSRRPWTATGGLAPSSSRSPRPRRYDYQGNYLLVLEGSCDIDGTTLGEDMLVVAKTVAPQPYRVATSGSGSCLALGVSF